MTVTILGLEVNVLAQVFGFFMMIFLIMSYQFKGEKLLVFMAIAYVFCLGEAITLHAVSNIVCTSVSIIRNLVIVWYMRKDKKVPTFITIVMLLPIVAVLIYSIVQLPWYECLPPIFVITFSILASTNNNAVIKIGSVFLESGYLVFDLFIGAYVGVIRQVIAVVAVIVGVIRYFKVRDKEKVL